MAEQIPVKPNLFPSARRFHIENYVVPIFHKLRIALEVTDPVIPLTDIISETYRDHLFCEEQKRKVCKKAGTEFKPTMFHYPTAVRMLLRFAGFPRNGEIYHAILKVSNERAVAANKKKASRIAVLKAKTNLKK
ncbi:MAG: hypothetical protein WAV11_02630 [Minisyncoccia bacterium]